jgi:hypothetical protein
MKNSTVKRFERPRARRSAWIAAAALAVLTAAGKADARPFYFETFQSHYGIIEGDNIDACGVCHIKWTGTGSRNPYGQSVEQQLYLGKSIMQALDDAGPMDPDGDGYSSVDEILTYMTLPGYNCENFVLAQGAPTGYDTYITPFVPTCLDPLDIRVSPTSTGAIIYVGEIATRDITVFNNGSEDPLEISSYALLPGAPASLVASGPPAPFTIPLGESVTIQLTFSPAAPIVSNTALRIESNDPDEAMIDIPITVAASADPTAPGASRAPCYAAIRKAMSKYAKTQLRVWNDCYLEELAGRACDTGNRDLRLGKAFAKLAAVIGGDKDKACAGAGLSRTTLGFPTTCAPGCEENYVAGIRDIPACLACVQDLVMEGVLRDGLGTAPPDLPPMTIPFENSYTCQQRIMKALQKGLLKMYAELGECELAAMSVESPAGECETSLDAVLDELRADIDASIDKCSSTTGLLGCRFEGMSPDAECLGNTAQSLADQLTDATFAISEP